MFDLLVLSQIIREMLVKLDGSIDSINLGLFHRLNHFLYGMGHMGHMYVIAKKYYIKPTG